MKIEFTLVSQDTNNGKLFLPKAPKKQDLYANPEEAINQIAHACFLFGVGGKGGIHGIPLGVTKQNALKEDEGKKLLRDVLGGGEKKSEVEEEKARKREDEQVGGISDEQKRLFREQIVDQVVGRWEAANVSIRRGIAAANALSRYNKAIAGLSSIMVLGTAILNGLAIKDPDVRKGVNFTTILAPAILVTSVKILASFRETSEAVVHSIMTDSVLNQFVNINIAQMV